MSNFFYLNVFYMISLTAGSQDYCDFIQNVQNYQDSVKLKYDGDYEIIDPKTFDINIYLSSFDNIEIEEGYKIGVYLMDDFLDGNPYLYAIKNDQRLKEKDNKWLSNFLNKPEARAKNHIVPKNNEIGFLQYLFFCEMGELFALKWHSYYNAGQSHLNFEYFFS